MDEQDRTNDWSLREAAYKNHALKGQRGLHVGVVQFLKAIGRIMQKQSWDEKSFLIQW